MRNVRKNDTVEVQTGDDAGKRGRVLRVFPAERRVVVEGVHVVTKHLRKSTQSPLGARMKREAPLALGNVLVVCPRCDRGVRVRHEVRPEGKVRLCRRCGEVLPVVRE
jgi:large subunit ribosomal protein L24